MAGPEYIQQLAGEVVEAANIIQEQTNCTEDAAVRAAAILIAAKLTAE